MIVTNCVWFFFFRTLRLSFQLWDKDLKFGRVLLVHKMEDEHFPVLCMVVNEHKQVYTSARDGTLRFFRRPWSHDTNETLLQTVMDDVTAIALSRNTNTLYSGDDKGIVTKWYHNQVGCQYNVVVCVETFRHLILNFQFVDVHLNWSIFSAIWLWQEEVMGLAIEGEFLFFQMICFVGDRK